MKNIITALIALLMFIPLQGSTFETYNNGTTSQIVTGNDGRQYEAKTHHYTYYVNGRSYTSSYTEYRMLYPRSADDMMNRMREYTDKVFKEYGLE